MVRLALLLAACIVFPLFAQSSGSAAAGPKKKSALDKTVMEEYVRHLFVWGPQITVKVADAKPSQMLPGFRDVVVTASAGQASQEVTFYVSADGARLVQGTVYDVAKNPFEGEIGKIRTDLQPSFGAAGAPVVVAMYSDFQCSFCKEEAKVIRQNLRETFPKDVRVYFKDYPLESIHPWAKAASVAGRCIFRQKPATFWDYHDWIFEKQTDISPENLKAKVLEFAATKGIDAAQFTTCFDTQATLGDIEKSVAEGRLLGVNSTPTMFVNGRRMVGQVPWANLKQVVEHEIEYANKNGGGEKCCEVKLPSPLNQ